MPRVFGERVTDAPNDKEQLVPTVEDFERKEEPKEPGAEASTTERMRHRMKTQKGREKYRLRQQTVEPVFGIINLAGRRTERPGTKD